MCLPIAAERSEASRYPAVMPHEASDARVAALTRLIDYAGLFPPARLDMPGAVAGYRAARSGAASWMVDRFICPASRLGEFATTLAGSPNGGEPPWRLTVTADGGADALGLDALAIEAFEAEFGDAATIESVETPLPSSDAAAWIARAADLYGRPTFFEIPWREGAADALDSVAAVRASSGHALGAKLRCGGLTAEAFPPPGVVATILGGCRDRGLPLKATAGLHHPFPYVDEDTGFTHHGFVNLLVAGVAADDGADAATLTEIVAEADPGSFTFGADELGWRTFRYPTASLARSRDRLFVGYGSCSFDEPVDDLTALGVLPVPT